MACQQFIQQINWPEYIMDNQPKDGMIVIPAYHQGIQTQDEVDDALVAVIHDW